VLKMDLLEPGQLFMELMLTQSDLEFHVTLLMELTGLFHVMLLLLLFVQLLVKKCGLTIPFVIASTILNGKNISFSKRQPMEELVVLWLDHKSFPKLVSQLLTKNCPNYGPTCVVPLDCNDGLACTIDECIQMTPPGTYHCDWSKNLTCNDTSICTSDRCDQLLGCVYDQILFCDDQNNCTIDFCDPVNGCVYTNVTCPDVDVCNLASCNPVLGCGSEQRDCVANLSTVLDNCTIAYCDVNYTQKDLDNPCQTTDVCAFFSPLGVGIAAGILALIIVLAILAALLFGGGVIAAATNIPVMNENAVQLNPLYMGADTGANNPLFAETV